DNKTIEENEINIIADESYKHVDYFEGLQKEEEPYSGFLGPDKEIPETDYDYQIKNYYPISGLFNLHSRWFGTPVSGSGITLDFLADGILNNTASRLYTGYDSKYSEMVFGASGYYSLFYPILIYGAELQTPVTNFFKEYTADLYAGFLLPFVFSEGIVNNTLSLQSIYLMNTDIYPTQSFKSAIQSEVSWSITEKKAKKDIIPNLGVVLDSEWYYSVGTTYYNFAYAGIKSYLPGFFENNGFTIEIEGNYNFDNALYYYSPINLPRGYSTSDYGATFILNTSVNYTFPIAYPDFAIGSFLYLSRLYMNAFVDTAITSESINVIKDYNSFLQSVGLELYLTFNIFNFTNPLEMGVRVLYDTMNQEFRIEDTVFLLGVTLP
ncbi:MAG: hypothetical protein PQJ46_04365, partial [Spirochaetales bacterium]|nr:hypothetical protein [Spirochaetales bacterium]